MHAVVLIVTKTIVNIRTRVWCDEISVDCHQ